MSRKKLFGLIILAAVAIFIAVVLIRPVTASEIHNGAKTYLGPVGVWMVDVYNGFVTSTFAQTYLTPPWNAFLIGMIFCGIIGLLLWKRDIIVVQRKKKVQPSVSTVETSRSVTPAGATTRPELPDEEPTEATE